jgi:hypothetical protein
MADSMTHAQTSIAGRVTHSDGAGHVAHARVTLRQVQTQTQDGSSNELPVATTRTDEEGRFRFGGLDANATYLLRATAFGVTAEETSLQLRAGGTTERTLDLALGFKLESGVYTDATREALVSRAVVGRRLVMQVKWDLSQEPKEIRWKPPAGASAVEVSDREIELVFGRSGRARIDAIAYEPDNVISNQAAERDRDRDGDQDRDRGRDRDRDGARHRDDDRFRNAEARTSAEIVVSEPEVQTIRGNVGVSLQRTGSEPTLDQALWVAIRNRTGAIGFQRYRGFINNVLGWDRYDRLSPVLQRRIQDLGTHLHGVGAYKILKFATEIFLLCECGVRLQNCRGESDPPNLLEESARLGQPVTAAMLAERLDDYLGASEQLPYLRRVVEASFPELERVASAREHVVIGSRIHEPCLLELFWCYWHEEGMLMQTMNAISKRFQNVRRAGDRDPLLNLEIDPLRPVNNLLWGFIQDEQNRLTVARRGYEYLHEYGLAIYGKAAPLMPAAAEVRSKFLEAFHNLLRQSAVFFKEDFQTTVIADGFPLLNALREVHLILAQGAHNQFGDMPWTARSEMLIAEYILSRPEIRDFLQSRVMVPYKEPWMAQVDMMKSIQGWSDVTVTHFRDLGVFGEQLLLSIRYGDWIDINDENAAKNWARYWRSEIQGYMHAYRAATGIDLTNPDSVDATVPALLLQKRTMQQRMR